MVCLDGFYLSYTAEPVEVPNQEVVDNYLAPRKPNYKPDINNPATFFSTCPVTSSELYEFRYNQSQAMKEALTVVKQVGIKYGEIFGRSYGLLDSYMVEDADLVLVTAGTTASTTRMVVDKLRSENVKAGLLKIRLFRPFPKEEIITALGLSLIHI